MNALCEVESNSNFSNLKINDFMLVYKINQK